MKLERVTGIGPASQAWEARILPLNNTRSNKAGHKLAESSREFKPFEEEIFAPETKKTRTLPRLRKNLIF